MKHWTIPSGWAWINLSQLVVELESGGRPKGGVRGITNGIPSIGGEHLTPNGSFDFSSLKYVPDSFASTLSKGWIKPDDILIVKDGATTGKTSIVDKKFPFPKATLNEHVFRLRADPDKVNQRFLFYFLWSESGQEMIRSAFRGSAQGGINQSFKHSVDVPLPSKEEQSIIVAQIDAMFIDISEGLLLNKEIKDDLRLLFDSALEQAINEALITTSNIFPLKEFGLAMNGRASGYGSSNIRVFKTKHVYPFSLKKNDPSYLSPEQSKNYPKDRYLLKGDVLVCNIGRGTLGRVCYVDDVEEKWTVDTSVMIIRTDKRCLGNWLAYYLYSKRGQKEILAREKGIAFADLRGQTHLYPREMITVPIPLPSLSIQRNVVDQLDEIRHQISESQLAQNETERLLKQAKQAILSRAFRGEL